MAKIFFREPQTNLNDGNRTTDRLVALGLTNFSPFSTTR